MTEQMQTNRHQQYPLDIIHSILDSLRSCLMISFRSEAVYSNEISYLFILVFQSDPVFNHTVYSIKAVERCLSAID